MECQRCAAAVSEGARFCPDCGHALIEEPGTNASETPGGEGRRPVSMRPSAPEFDLGPAAAGVAQLAVIGHDGSTGDVYQLKKDVVDIGRQEGVIRLPEDRFIAPRHARITRRGSEFLVRDLGSLNGVYVRLRQARPLQDGDVLLLGSEALVFRRLKDAERGHGPATDDGTLVYGSPIRPRYARLTQRTAEGVSRNVFYIFSNDTVIGRESGDVVFTADSFMSRRHACIKRDPATGEFTLEDLGSSNGTYLALRGEVALASGDFLRVGQHLFRFGFGA